MKKNVWWLKQNCDCESSQKIRGNKIRPVFSAFGSEKQKWTTSVVSRLLDHIGTAPQGAVSLNPPPLKETYSDGLSRKDLYLTF